MYCFSPTASPDLTHRPEKVISLVGGGGKTSLMYHLACTQAAVGKKVLLAATTHIFFPDRDFYAPDAAAAHRLWARGSFAVIGTPQGCKLAGPEPDLLDVLMDQADLTILESDGSKGLPIKAPRETEPVLHPKTELVCAVMGLSALEKPLDQVCFSSHLASEILGKSPEDPLTEADAAQLLSCIKGGRKDVGSRPFAVILNQCDGEARLRQAQAVSAGLLCRGVHQIYFTGFSPEEREKLQAISKEHRT